MFVEHIAIWVRDLEKMAEFYETYFGAQRSEKYHNTKTGFQSYFLRFDSGSRIELTTKQHLHPGGTDTLGYTHLAGSEKPSGSGCLCPTFCLRWLSSAERSPHNRGWLL